MSNEELYLVVTLALLALSVAFSTATAINLRRSAVRQLEREREQDRLNVQAKEIARDTARIARLPSRFQRELDMVLRDRRRKARRS